MDGNLEMILEHSAGISAMIAALASLVTAVGTYLNGRQGRGIHQSVNEGVAVSNRNRVAIEQVRHDLQNGVGQSIATKAVEHMKPVLEEAAIVAADRLKEVADVAAERLKSETQDSIAKIEGTSWVGPDRQSGPPDRRSSSK